MKIVFVTDEASIVADDAATIYVLRKDSVKYSKYVVVNGVQIEGIMFELCFNGSNSLHFSLSQMQRDIVKRRTYQTQVDAYLSVINAIREWDNIYQVIINRWYYSGRTLTREEMDVVRPLVDQITAGLSAMLAFNRAERVEVEIPMFNLSLRSVKHLSGISGTNYTNMCLETKSLNDLYSMATAEDEEEFQGKRRIHALNFSDSTRSLRVVVLVNGAGINQLQYLQFCYMYMRERQLRGLPVTKDLRLPYYAQVVLQSDFGYAIPFYVDNFPGRSEFQWIRNNDRPTVKRLFNTFSVITLLSAKQVPRIGVNSFARLLPKELYRRLADFLPGLNEQDKIEYGEFMKDLK
jgi:hypothetical protein